MSTRSNLRPHSVITDGSMGADITSQVTILQSLTLGAYTYSWSGTTPIGVVEVQVSNDYKVGADGVTVLNAGTWIPIYFTLNGSSVVNQIPITGNSGVGIVEWSTGAYAIRTFYDRTSGTGTLQTIINGKVA